MKEKTECPVPLCGINWASIAGSPLRSVPKDRDLRFAPTGGAGKIED